MSLTPLGPANEIFSISLLLIAGFAGGSLVKTLKIPAITGNILAGILVGPYGLHLLSYQAVTINLKPIMSFALAFVAFSIATHIDIKEIIETNGRAFITGVSDVFISSASVTLAIYLFTHDFILSLLLGVVSGATAPATVLAIVKETHARGPVTDLILPHVALNNLACVALFGFVFAGIKGSMVSGATILTALTQTAVIRSSASILIGVGVGLAIKFFFPRLEHEASILPLMLVSLLFVSGVSSFFHVSPLLSSMALGFLTHNLIEEKEAVERAFFSLEPVIYTAFFTLAGAHLQISLLPSVGAAGVLYILSRLIGKWLGTFLSGWVSGASTPFRNLAGLALLPQAGIALGLIVLIQDEACCAKLAPRVTAIVVAAVAVHEIIGPVFTKITLKLAGEIGKDLHPVMGFLLPQGIILDLESNDKWAVIRQMVAHLATVYQLSTDQEADLLNSVIERENSLTTGIGHGLAIPHGVLEGDGSIMGVMGISNKGVDFGSLDGKRAHIILLTAVHKDQLASHLDILMKISRMFSQEGLFHKLLSASSNEQAYEILYNMER